MNEAKTMDELLIDARDALWALMDAYHERQFMSPDEAEYEAVFYARKCAEHHARQMIGPVVE